MSQLEIACDSLKSGSVSHYVKIWVSQGLSRIVMSYVIMGHIDNQENVDGEKLVHEVLRVFHSIRMDGYECRTRNICDGVIPKSSKVLWFVKLEFKEVFIDSWWVLNSLYSKNASRLRNIGNLTWCTCQNRAVRCSVRIWSLGETCFRIFKGKRWNFLINGLFACEVRAETRRFRGLQENLCEGGQS